MRGTVAGGPSSQSPQPSGTAADVMGVALTTVEPYAHVAAAAYLMKHAGARALVVVDGEQANRPVGLITEADVCHAVADGKDVNDVRIEDLMTMSPTVIQSRTTIRDAANLMMAGHFRHLPVVDETGLAGMVDIEDICRTLLDRPSRESRPPLG